MRNAIKKLDEAGDCQATMTLSAEATLIFSWVFFFSSPLYFDFSEALTLVCVEQAADGHLPFSPTATYR